MGVLLDEAEADRIGAVVRVMFKTPKLFGVFHDGPF
jgi:hypothetical protein